MTLVDAVLALFFLLSLWTGYRSGLLAAGVDLLCLIAGAAFAFWVQPAAVAWLRSVGVDWGVWSAPACLIGGYLLARLVLGLLLGRLLARVPAPVHRHPANRVLGLVPGAANGLINATVLVMLWLAWPLSGVLADSGREHLLADRLAEPAGWLDAQLSPIFDPALEKTAARLAVQPQAHEAVTLPFKVANATPRPALEAQMLELVNQEREANGLRPLVADPDALPVARAHSQDMFARGYFSHETPEGKTPFDRLRAAGLRFRAAGENLALARTLPMAHTGLMNSPGHRANILQPAYGRVGIGILDGGRYGLMVTQNFRN